MQYNANLTILQVKDLFLIVSVRKGKGAPYLRFQNENNFPLVPVGERFLAKQNFFHFALDGHTQQGINRNHEGYKRAYNLAGLKS